MKKMNISSYKENFYVIVVSLLSVIVLTGFLWFRTTPIYNINNEPIIAPNGKHLTLKEIEKAIMTAGLTLGWEMKPIQPGLIEATLRKRSHVAIVNITIDTRFNNITYKESENLKYHAGKIHVKYIEWVENLNKAIKAQITALSYN